MSIAIVLSLSAQANLLALLQAKADELGSDVVFTSSNVAFSEATAGSFPDSKGNVYNTSVLVTALPGSGLTGSKTLYYTRLAINEAVLAPQSSYTLGAADNNATVLAQVAKALGLVASEISLDGTVARPADGSSQTLNVIVTTGSLLYTAQSFQITLTWQQDLDSIFSDPYLPGFVAADEPESTAESTGESTGEVQSS
jgi:hypothetical protein